MTEPLAYESDSRDATISAWWASHRLRYNVGLVVAGVIGFVFYALGVDHCIDVRAPGDWEITVFTTVFQGFAYLLMMGVANLCYYLGPWSEQLLHPTNAARYRKIAFSLGFCFSVLLPLIPGALLFISCAMHAGEEKRIITELLTTAAHAASALI